MNLLLHYFEKLVSFFYKRFKPPCIELSLIETSLDTDNFIGKIQVKNNSMLSVDFLNFYMNYYYKRICVNYFISPSKCEPNCTDYSFIKLPKYMCFGETTLYVEYIMGKHKSYIQEYGLYGDTCLNWEKTFIMRRDTKLKRL